MAIALKGPENITSPWMTAAEAARMAGVSITSVRHWRISKKVRSTSIEGHYFLWRLDVEKWIGQRKGKYPLPSKLPGIGSVITSTEAARRLQVTVARINQWLREGRIVFSRQVFVTKENNHNAQVVLVSAKEIQDLFDEREANGVVNDPGISVPVDDPCPIPEERLIGSAHAAKLLGVNITNLTAWRMAGRIKFDIKRRRVGSGQPIGTFYDREEIVKCKEERDKITSLENDPDWMGWRDLAAFIGIKQYILRGYIRDKALPHHTFPLGRRNYTYYYKPEIVEWAGNQNE